MAYTTIDDPSAYFQAKTYTGNGGTNAITFDGNSDLSPDFVWLKMRSHADNHALYDSVRGTTKTLYSNLTEAEYTESTSLTAFGSDGFTLGADALANANTKTFVSWNWKESATAGFDIVSYTGNNSNRTISHSLSAVPKMMIIKRRTGTATAWLVYHASVGATKGLNLNTTATPDTASTYFQDTAPSSSVFTLGATGEVNADSATYINYLFADVQGYSKFGSYIGNGSSSDGTFVYTGFRPAWIMRKNTDGTADWRMDDNKRRIYNTIDFTLFPNKDNAETQSAGYGVDLLSNGFKIRGDSGNQNDSGTNYIYMAFAENPFVTSTGIPTTAR